MLMEASRELNLDLNKSLLVGDRLSDMEAGSRAGVHTLVHVVTELGLSERAAIKAWAKRQQKASSQYLGIEDQLMDNLVALLNSLISKNK